MDRHICPLCGSTELKSSGHSRRPSFSFSCDCGYIGICPLIDDSDIAAFRQELKEAASKKKEELG
ncbi:MAG: hypothetical protein NDI94_00720 [Candidatus Woesearchaeota archaeon]|nr:hypothetical protein [Candidatus Woesearchaeota archaeon]